MIALSRLRRSGVIAKLPVAVMSWALFASDASGQSSATLTVRVQVVPACEAAAAANASGAEVYALCAGAQRRASRERLGRASLQEAQRPLTVRRSDGDAGGEPVEVWTVIY
jgi:hypothetical protein